MEKNKAEVLKESFSILDAEYGDKLTEQTRIFKKELFKKIIGEYPIEKIKEMVRKIIKYRKYNSFPKIAEMVEIIEGNKEEEAEMAWMYLQEVIAKEGYYRSVSFPKYPAIGNIIVSYGGWTKFLETMTDDEEKWIKKEFIKMYYPAKNMGNYPKRLPGYFELENNKKGYDNETMIRELGMTIDGRKVEKPKRIGDKGVMPLE